MNKPIVVEIPVIVDVPLLITYEDVDTVDRPDEMVEWIELCRFLSAMSSQTLVKIHDALTAEWIGKPLAQEYIDLDKTIRGILVSRFQLGIVTPS